MTVSAADQQSLIDSAAAGRSSKRAVSPSDLRNNDQDQIAMPTGLDYMRNINGSSVGDQSMTLSIRSKRSPFDTHLIKHGRKPRGNPAGGLRMTYQAPHSPVREVRASMVSVSQSS